MTGTYEENIALIEKYKNGDNDAAEQLIKLNLGLVKSIAIRFTGRGCELEDLIQIGSLGLIKAIDGFDRSFGTAFSTYAVPMITGEIKRYLRDDGLIKVSRSAKKNARLLLNERQRILAQTGREPHINELCELCGISYDDAIFALDASKPTISLQQKVHDDSETEICDLLAQDDEIDLLCEKTALRQAIKKLPENESNLLYLRYFKDLTQVQTAKILGITQVKVSRTEKKILEKLKSEFL